MTVNERGQNAPRADVLDVRVPAVRRVDRAADLDKQVRIPRERFQADGLLVVGPSPTFDSDLVERQQRGEVPASVADDDGLADQRIGREIGLDVLGRDVLAVRGDDQVLLAPGDAQVAVIVERAEVAGTQPAVVVDEGVRCVLVVPITRGRRSRL